MTDELASHLVHAAAGGAVIGMAVSILWVAIGRAAGISGILGGVLELERDDLSWRLAFLVGLGGGGLVMAQLAPSLFAWGPPRSMATVIVSGLLVGFGTRLGGGCTSGHGLCGISRLSVRSIVATGVFMAMGMAAVFVVRHALGVAA